MVHAMPRHYAAADAAYMAGIVREAERLERATMRQLAKKESK